MSTVIIPIVTAIITGGLSLLGVYFSNRKSAALIEYRIQQLEEKQDVHNRLIERTYKLEDRANITDERVCALRARVDDLERKAS